MDFIEQLEKRSALVEEALDKNIPPKDAYPPVIHEAVRYSLMGGGKRLRPVLTLASAEALEKDPEPLLPAACAIEMIHTYSLVHDDLPAMDNDDYRRGQLTSHKMYGEAIAILVGDSLLTMAFDLLSRLGEEKDFAPQQVLQVISEISSACGTTGLIGGQVVDTIYEDSSITSKELDYIHSCKTGALYRVAVRTGAILSGASDYELEQLTGYAENLGLAFQIIDDILDVEGDSEQLGKPAGSDEKNKKATYPSFYGLETARKKAQDLVKEAENKLEPFGDNALFMRNLLYFVLSRNF